MTKTRKAVLSCAFGAAGAAFGFGCGVLSNEYLLHKAISESEARADLLQARSHLSEVLVTLRVTERSIGEACLKALAPYSVTGVLSRLSEDTVVVDLMTDPKQPCGNTPSAIRLDLRSIVDAQIQVTNAQAAETASQDYLKNTDFHKPLIDEGVWMMAALGATAGVASVVFARETATQANEPAQIQA